MSPERLKKVEEIFHAALDLPQNERDAFLLESCLDDLELRREIDSLLAFEDEFDTRLDTPPDKIAAELVAERDNSEIIGKQINQYKILSLLGVGGMGAVYLCYDTKLERKVALKMLEGELAEDATRLSRFFKEAKSASALNHPNILTVHEIGETDGSHFIATEFIDGKTLKQFLVKENPTLDSVLEIASQIASALSVAHEAGIVHRDIKPDNIMVRKDGIVKILDFGIAKLTDIANTGEIVGDDKTLIKATTTMPGMIIGTPQYMSPEQARGQTVDQRSDIFSFGVVLYEMICGKPPFNGTTNMDILGSILKDEPKPLSEYLEGISAELERIISKTLRKDREKRYQHIKDVYIDLNDAKKTIQLGTSVVNRTLSTRARTTAETSFDVKQPWRFSIPTILLSLFILAGLIGGIYWFVNKQKQSVQNFGDLKNVDVANWASSPGEIYSVGSFSPDAKMVAFASSKSGTQNIWVKQTSSGESVQVTKDEFGNKYPVWSPDGEEIAFFSARGNQPGIWRIPVLGGSPILIASITDGSSLLRFWSGKNQIYYESRNEMMAVDAASGEIKQISDFKAKNINARSISLSTDEQKLAFITSENQIWTLWIKNLSEDAPQKILESKNEMKNTVWHPDGERIFYSSRADDSFQIFTVDPDSPEPKQLSFGDKDDLVLDVSTDGSKILFGSAKEESDVWGVNLKDSKEFTVASDIDSELWADSSSAEKTVVFQSVKNLSQGNKLFNASIFLKPLNNNQPPTKLVSDGFLPIFSPDGKKIAFMKTVGRKYHLETINTNGDGQKLLTDKEIAPITNSVLPYNRLQNAYFSWSPDGAKIAYISELNNQNNIRVVNVEISEDVQITENADGNLIFNCPMWSDDGKNIAFTSKTNNSNGKITYSLSVTNIDTKTTKLLTQKDKFFRLIGWMGNDELMLASIEGSSIASTTTEVTLTGFQLSGAKTREIAKLKDAYLYNIHLSPDKKNIAFAVRQGDKDNISVMPSVGGNARKVTENNDSRLYFSSLSWSPDNNSIFFGKQSRYSLLSMLTNFK
ncbi:MAG: serine/threonine-protein kinase [Pyrinomonadaceae bacterium]|nr:serine/threonine-protein kinase [Pyrinomonadaceae bacterium]